MRRTILCLSSIVLGGSGLLAAAGAARGGDRDTCDRAEVVKFLKEAVIGRTLATPKTTFPWDDGKAEGEVEDQYTYHDLTETAHGFCFDVTTVSRIMFYDLDKEGRRVQPGRAWRGTTVVRYEIGERASTKQLTGFCRVLSTTNKDSRPTGTVRIITGMRLSDGKLTWEATRPGYADAPAAGGTYKPAAIDGKETFLLEDGKLRNQTDLAFFDVDPDTLRRSPSPNKTLTLVAKEVADR